MASATVLFVAIISILIGLGAGLGAGYIGLNPQVNRLIAQQESNSVQNNLQQEINAAKQEIEAKNAKLASLDNTVSVKESELATLRNRLAEFEKKPAADVLAVGERRLLLDQIQKLEAEVGQARDLLKSTQDPNLKLLGPIIEKIAHPGAEDEHVVHGWVVNFGSQAAMLATVKVEWLSVYCVGLMQCETRWSKAESIVLTNVRGRSVTEFKESYSFNQVVDQGEQKRTNIDFNWR